MGLYMVEWLIKIGLLVLEWYGQWAHLINMLKNAYSFHGVLMYVVVLMGN